jgi:hypothetical protein
MGEDERLRRLQSDREAVFPQLGISDYEVTSTETSEYNCIAYAAGDKSHKWDCPPIPTPGYYWPRGAARGDEVAALISAFETLGYEVCSDGTLEPGFEKVAVYVDIHGDWTHAARQRADGHWMSKLGDWEDIRHATPMDVGDGDYGVPSHYMKRPTGSVANDEASS